MINSIKINLKKIKKFFIKDVVISVEQVGQNQTYLYSDEFTYILNLYELYKMTHKVPGHIVEIGVANGRNSIIFGQLIKNFGDSATKKYHGIDTFDGYSQIDLNKEMYLDDNRWKNINYESIQKRLSSLGLGNISKLYKLDAYNLEEEFLKKGGYQFQPNSLLVSLLYIDCNSYGAAKHSINTLLPYLANGAIIAIDEKKLGGETKALREIAEEQNLKLEKNQYPSIYTYVVNKDSS